MASIQNEIEIKSWWVSLQDASSDYWVGITVLPVVRERQTHYPYTYPCWIPITIPIPILHMIPHNYPHWIPTKLNEVAEPTIKLLGIFRESPVLFVTDNEKKNGRKSEDVLFEKMEKNNDFEKKRHIQASSNIWWVSICCHSHNLLGGGIF